FKSGDILVVKHKIVSKSADRIVDLATIKPSAHSIAWARKYKLNARVIELALRQSRAIIRRKNGVLITETRHGFICANSGVDVSNVDGGRHAVLLPADPDRSSRKLHRQLKKLTALAIPVLITDTFGRPWREGLVDFCIGIAGMKALRDDRGRPDRHGAALATCFVPQPTTYSAKPLAKRPPLGVIWKPAGCGGTRVPRTFTFGIRKLSVP